MDLQTLKSKTAVELMQMAEDLDLENIANMRRQELLVAILKQLAENDVTIHASGVMERLQDGFGFLRSPESNYLPGPDDIYVAPHLVKQYALRTGDTVYGDLIAPQDNERYFAINTIKKINFDVPEKSRHRVNFDNLTALFPNQKLNLEIEQSKDRTPRIIDLISP
ncbi:MAG: Rho termination factor N-terminal domain-containing protein, partial [Alphaproteobacteria bacterium]